uniref:NADH-ubiquinone oxidoreductase chain 2 n=1 Tax=Eysarcoris guttigerus TaxID=702485 RepID=A0A6G8QSX0_EYSGU|nr:NADH dehydrogenase subunit 2 [Eysarcoris guttigerus]QIN90457.1 NADH dehydrogenase subunit 2 [Eysarcoris guttigerus]
MKKSQWLFSLILITSVAITLSANNWISMWMGLELNMMAFIPIILNDNNKLSSEAAMIYFLVQSFSSLMLLLMLISYMCKYLIYGVFSYHILTISILIKLGAAPFHSWFPKIASMMNWKKNFILMTWQKVMPLMMISNMSHNSNMIINMAIIMSIIIGSIGGINQVSLRKLMSYSSINHVGWMLSINKSMNLWLIYLMIYSMMMFMMYYMFNNYSIYFLNQLNSLNMNMSEKFNMIIMMMSMGGLPPFMGFMTKWITIQSLMNTGDLIMIFIMIMFSLITLMYYMRIMINMFLMNSTTIKWSTTNMNKYIMSTMMCCNLSLPMFLILDLI